MFVVMGFWFLYDLYKFYLWAFKVPKEAVLIKAKPFWPVKSGTYIGGLNSGKENTQKIS